MININTLKDRFISASIVEKLIYINIAVFILTFIFQLFQGCERMVDLKQ